jgi:hypothetical protein
MFLNSVLKKILVHVMDVVSDESHKKEVHVVLLGKCYAANMATTGKTSNIYGILSGNPKF